MSYSFDDADRNRFDATDYAETDNKDAVKRFVKELAGDPLLGVAIAAVGFSLGLQLAGRTKAATFVGLWAPTLLLLGIYRRATANKTDTSQEQRFEGGCSTPPDEMLGDGYLAAAREVDDYSDQISRAIPHKAK